MHPLARASNEQLPDRIYRLLSEKGRQIYFPSAGILGQSAEARGRRINATIGIALEDDGSPMHLPGIDALFNIDARDAFPYAPSYGKPALRDQWLTLLRSKNPHLHHIELSRPVVTNALTHALSVAGTLLLDPGDQLIVSDLFWGNYRLIFEHGCGAQLKTFETFAGEGFHVGALRDALMEGPPGKRVLLLNFPNNPTGYTCTEREAQSIVDVCVEAARSGRELAVIVDDAYFGLVYEDGIMRESIFGRLADAHPGILAVKVDGATKEDFAWGFRVGFLTYGFHGATTSALTALADKTAGLVRGSISNASHLSQSLLLAAYENESFAQWKLEKYDALKARYDEVRRIFTECPHYRDSFIPLPFNSGYFLCVRPTKAAPEAVRRILLDTYDTGVIATGDLIRIAFSSTPHQHIATLFENVHHACQQAQSSGAVSAPDEK
ncbi:MAG: aminotransferase class I/II-fold pyridoxal phosphate-dependent enzyme [Myxococcota bacterium]|nr:aminotransferase class I/II-fold pyridoxal phosphate-dependent enzyme [Myxococcota bacterium]